MRKKDISKMSFSDIYPLYIQKAQRKGHSKQEVDQIIFWLTGYNEDTLKHQIDNKVDLETFFNEEPHFNKNAILITGSICGIRVEDIQDPLTQKIRYLDKLIDELAHNKTMSKILRADNKVS